MYRLPAQSRWPLSCTAAQQTERRTSYRQARKHDLHGSMMMLAVWCGQELAQGRTLADLVASGWRADEAEAKRIARELLGVLDYLGSRRPAVTHR